MTTLRIRHGVAVVGMAVGALGTAGAALAAGGATRSVGPDFEYGADNPMESASASVQVVHTGNGRSLVTLHVFGADADAGRTFGAHVHQSPCGPVATDSGGHYQHAGALGSLEEREVWLDFTLNAGGNGHATANRPWSLDEASPRSVVIHALPTAADTGAAGARLACIDLDGEH